MARGIVYLKRSSVMNLMRSLFMVQEVTGGIVYLKRSSVMNLMRSLFVVLLMTGGTAPQYLSSSGKDELPLGDTNR